MSGEREGRDEAERKRREGVVKEIRNGEVLVREKGIMVL